MSDTQSQSDRPSGSPDAEPVLHLSQFAHGGPAPSVDADLGGSPGSATDLIRKVTAEALAESRKPLVVPRNAAPLAPDEMLGAVAYCYVKGVFSSADIELMMLRDSEFRGALDGVVPSPEAIRKFRRLNREAIQVVLEKFYARLRQQQKRIREVMPGAEPPEASGPLLPGSGSLLETRPRCDENTAVFVRREALDRLDKATFIDGMSDY